MKKIGLLICINILFLLSTVNAQYQSISLIVNDILRPGEEYTYKCLASKNSYSTPEIIYLPSLSYEIIDPIYIPTTDIFSINGDKLIVNDFIDAKLKIRITCTVDNLKDSKIVTVIPSTHMLNPDNYAVLLIHGLAGHSRTWNDFIDNLDNTDRRFVRSSKYKLGDNKIPLFTIDFSDNQNLSFNEQGSELNTIIEKIIKDFGKRKIILFAHSMGGLAARSYILKFGTNRVAGLVTAATPHAGAFLADLPEELHFQSKLFWEKIISPSMGLNLDLNSKAIQYLRPDSDEMTELLNQEFPLNIPVVLCNSLLINPHFGQHLNLFNQSNKIFFEYISATSFYDISNIFEKSNLFSKAGSDGVVPFTSQFINLGISNCNSLSPKIFVTNKFHNSVPKDINFMSYSLNAMLNSILEENLISKNASSEKKFIGFILDSSGSMSSNDPNGIRKSAVNQILDLISNDVDVFIVDFDGSGKWLNKREWENWNVETLKAYVNSINSSGGTNLGAGLNAMKKALEGKHSSKTFGGVLMFTDGKGSYNNEAAWFQEHNIPVHTISYTSQADAATMNKIAEVTGGIYLQARNEEDVISAIGDYFNSIVGYNKICSYSGNILQGQNENYEFYLDTHTKRAIYNLSWMGSLIGLKLVAPDGSVYEEKKKGEWFVGKNYTSVKIKDPVGGRWKAVFTGVKIPRGGEAFRFEVSGDTPSKFKLNNQCLPTGQIVFNLIEENKTINTSSILPEIIVETPKQKKLDVSDSYNNGSFSFFPFDGHGNYDVNMRFQVNDKQGNFIQREFRKSILIGDEALSFIATVDYIMGNVITTQLGRWKGNQEGLKCYIYSPNGSKANAKAIGVVSFVQDKDCQIEISEFLGGASGVQLGDIVELDFFQWQNDKPKFNNKW